MNEMRFPHDRLPYYPNDLGVVLVVVEDSGLEIGVQKQFSLGLIYPSSHLSIDVDPPIILAWRLKRTMKAPIK